MGLKKRIIPVLLLREGKLVQSRNFSRYSIIGDPIISAQRMSSWSSDELFYLDITREKAGARDQIRHADLLNSISGSTNVPLAFGGGIRTKDQVRQILQNGADKVVLNTLIYRDPQEVREIVDSFGSQAVVASIDVKAGPSGDLTMYCGGLAPSALSLESLLERIHNLGCGEILVNSIERDGAGGGFNVSLVRRITSISEVPVIALGGAGDWSHFEQLFTQTTVSAAAAANIFQHSENSVYSCKEFLRDRDVSVRRPPPLNQRNQWV